MLAAFNLSDALIMVQDITGTVYQWCTVVHSGTVYQWYIVYQWYTWVYLYLYLDLLLTVLILNRML